MKAILVIDVPNGCWECPCNYFDEEGTSWCNAVSKATTEGNFERQSWCPLRPMPKLKINEKRVEFLNMTEREKHFYELGHDDASDEFYEEILNDSN